MKYKLLVLATILPTIVGCATPMQNAALAGAVAGALTASAMHPPIMNRPLMCYNTSYRDVYGRLIRRTTCQ